MKRVYFIFLILFTFSCISCQHTQDKVEKRSLSCDTLRAWQNPTWALRSTTVRRQIKDLCWKEGTKMYADTIVTRYYQNEQPLIWVSEWGVNSQADSLLVWLQNNVFVGLDKSAFHYNEIAGNLKKIRTLNFRQNENANTLWANTEFYLTSAYIRLACGLRYGFLNPHTTFNTLDQEDAPARNKYKCLYDIKPEVVTDSFINVAIQELKNQKLVEFLASVQPQDTLYHKLLASYRNTPTNDTVYREKLRVNMERRRWRIPRPSTNKYIAVNLAEFMLSAYNHNTDSVLTMKVCGGNTKHKSPILHSHINRMELNPYWIVPNSIIRKEIAPVHAGSSDYFERNRIRIIDNETREELKPDSVTAAMLKSGRYMLRQDKGAGNSLGRIVFRFPNRFAVYLHDTNSPGAFRRTSRAVSHGCIRLEKPYDLATFLLDSPSPEFIDKIRIAIDLPARTAQGKAWKATPGYKHMKNYDYQTPIPVFIHYHTLYPNAAGEICSLPDPYGYDKIMKKILNSL